MIPSVPLCTIPTGPADRTGERETCDSFASYRHTESGQTICCEHHDRLPLAEQAHWKIIL